MVLDVHPPHSPMHGIRDFLLHLFTITVGLLIALGLEGCVERAHHRHLVHEAEASLHTEIKDNAKAIAGALEDLHKQQATLRHDVEVLQYIIKNHKAPPEHSEMEISFRVYGLNDVGWKTAQTTAALSYMPYPEVQEYADIYSTQDKFNVAELQAVRDATVSLGPFISGKKEDPDPTGGEAANIKEKIQTLAGQLSYLDSLMKSLDGQYKKFLSAHPKES
ncbi:MAG TPA: hypothetical protein VGG95_13280 [Edaphobacter sp.]|jgi:hypothetical protein